MEAMVGISRSSCLRDPETLDTEAREVKSREKRHHRALQIGAQLQGKGTSIKTPKTGTDWHLALIVRSPPATHALLTPPGNSEAT